MECNDNSVKRFCEELLITGINTGSSFIDIGSGTGRFALSIASYFGCKVQGVEINESRYLVSTSFQKERFLSKQPPRLVEVLRKAKFYCSCISDIEEINDSTHVFCFINGFNEALIKHLIKLVNESRSIQWLCVLGRSKQRYSWLLSKMSLSRSKFITSFPMKLAVSGSGNTCLLIEICQDFSYTAHIDQKSKETITPEFDQSVGSSSAPPRYNLRKRPCSASSSERNAIGSVHKDVVGSSSAPPHYNLRKRLCSVSSSERNAIGSVHKDVDKRYCISSAMLQRSYNVNYYEMECTGQTCKEHNQFPISIYTNRGDLTCGTLMTMTTKRSQHGFTLGEGLLGTTIEVNRAVQPHDELSMASVIVSFRNHYTSLVKISDNWWYIDDANVEPVDQIRIEEIAKSAFRLQFIFVNLLHVTIRTEMPRGIPNREKDPNLCFISCLVQALFIVINPDGEGSNQILRSLDLCNEFSRDFMALLLVKHFGEPEAIVHRFVKKLHESESMDDIILERRDGYGDVCDVVTLLENGGFFMASGLRAWTSSTLHSSTCTACSPNSRDEDSIYVLKLCLIEEV